MKKNLKKALSAVIALAVAVSMIPASFAAKLTLTDVAETASYATAVNTLVALDIINGYEDNSFKPDNLITRAETTKVVVAALNKIDVAEGMKGNTGFTDVEARHEWATGFINAGVSEGFINGMENNTFGPDLNVTYAQIVTMLVRALGYEEYAQYMGGYPNGYLSIANSEGVTKGVSAGANTPVTRAQVAVLVYNALQTPIVANTGMVYSASAGGFVPNIEKMDGTGDNKYKTLLTEDFDAYFVEGYVVSTSKSNSALKADEIEFTLAKSEKYADDDFRTADDKTTSTVSDSQKANGTFTVKVADTDAVNYNGSYAQAIIRVDDNGDKVLVSFIPSGKNAVVDCAANLIDTENLTDNGDGTYSLPATVNYLEYFASESASKSSKYNLAKDSNNELEIKLYVNGVLIDFSKIDTTKTVDVNTRYAIGKYVINNNVGNVQLVDTYKTDNFYDTIYVNYYATAKITAVNATSGKITLSDTYGATGTSITLDDENDDLTYHIYYNGEEISISDLKIDDVISIAYDVTGTLAKSNFYDIYVSREVKTAAKLTSKNAADRVLKFAGEAYDLVADYDAVQGEYSLGSEYDLYIDAFGRIFLREEAEAADRYAIIDKYKDSSSDDEYRAYLYTAEGVSKTYVVDAAKVEVFADGTSVIKGDGTNKTAVRNAIKTKVYGSTTSSDKVAVQNRVVKYKVNSSTGYITMLDFITSNKNTSDTSADFNARTNALGTIRMDSSTKVVNAIDYVKNSYDKVSDLSTSSVDKFVDSKGYTAYAFGKRNSNSIDPFVVVTVGSKTFDENTRFAVVADAPGQSQDDAGDDIITLPIFYKGAENDEKQTLYVTDDATGSDASKLEVGDIIVFSANSKGYADELYLISNWAGKIADYDAIFANTVADTEPTNFVNLDAALLKNSDNWSNAWANYKKEDVTILYGVIVGRSSKNLSLGQINTTAKTVGTKKLNAWTDQNAGIIDIALSSETNVYQYDYSQSAKNRLSVINSGSIPFTSFNKSYVFDDVISWDSDLDVDGKTEKNTNREIANFAYVLVADGEALDVLVLSAK